jgi:hypothetical protein
MHRTASARGEGANAYRSARRDIAQGQRWQAAKAVRLRNRDIAYYVGDVAEYPLSLWSERSVQKDPSMTKCKVGQRLRQRVGDRIVEAVASYDDGRKHDWTYIDNAEPAGRHWLATMLIGWYPI